MFLINSFCRFAESETSFFMFFYCASLHCVEKQSV
nr:MAG TPA: hypothetical protein [Caudoviricetes sp.]